MKKNEIDKIAKEIANKIGNDALNDPKSPSFIRFMMYSCAFFSATGQCGGVSCKDCKATKVIENGLKFNPEMKDEYETLKRTR